MSHSPFERKSDRRSETPVQRSSRRDGGSGRYAVQLRALSFDEGDQLLRPPEELPPDGPVQMKQGAVQAKMPAPGAKSRMSPGSTYTKIYDLEKKVGKAKEGKRKDKLVSDLLKRVERYLANHSGKKNDKERERVLAVRELLVRLKGGDAPVIEDTPPEQTPPTPETTPPTTGEGTDVPPPDHMPPPLEQVPDVPPPQDLPPLPPEVTDDNVGQVLSTLGLPVVELGTDNQVEAPKTDEGSKDVPPPEGLPPEPKPPSEVTPEKKDEQEGTNIPVAPPLPTAKDKEAPDYGVLPSGVTLEQLLDPTVELPVTDLAKLSYVQLVQYLDTRDKGHVETLRSEAKFVDAVMKFSGEQVANIVVRIILRTPGSVVDRGGARDEAIRILTSQLRAKYIAKKLLTGDVLVVIVPKNVLMTDLPEFASLKDTYTFDGRPWDITRGSGGKNTAIAEENLLGEDVGTDPTMTKQGWNNQTDYEQDKNANTTTKKTRDYNPGVYCSGYSTTNHEFFHTIHQYGLPATDSGLIKQLYDAKKSQPNAVEWADGPRLDQSNNPMENYASSTVYEYFAQTGCAYQGTNKGTDPSTGRPRNNGKGWVETNEPGLAGLIARTCADEELKGVNPSDLKKRNEAMQNGGVQRTAERRMLGKNGLSNNSRLMANRARLERAMAPQNPPGVLVENK